MTSIKPYVSKRKEKIEKKSNKKAIFYVVGGAGVLLALANVTIVLSMLVLQAYSFRSPVIFQNPFVLRVNSPKPTISKPMPLKKAEVTPSPTPMPEAKITPFKKYITADANEVRNLILPIIEREYDADNAVAFDNIIKKESGYRPDAVNEIGAGGLCQAYPASKMGCPIDASKDAAICQLNWCSKYLKERYGSPVQGYEFHVANNWF